MKRPRMMLLKRKVQNLYTIIARLCYRVRTSHVSAVSLCASPCVHVCVCVFVWQDLVFLMDDCEAIDTGHGTPTYAEDRLQLLKEER